MISYKSVHIGQETGLDIFFSTGLFGFIFNFSFLTCSACFCFVLFINGKIIIQCSVLYKDAYNYNIPNEMFSVIFSIIKVEE